ncbi:PilZ domain-containing protein [Thiovibrio frasassiensis]|uniref:PilZ domain-containing protein n=1 Tax=Thiovibrio frasassiensis TaxID=2984131 RepID=A0A9X4RM49_9BACT|nr:PilZ domain-containing protein [Thiovibrio frasassiensis]MDG4476766.1 PilZ domain-containing protein [Thiovibrio frasassiensis]
MGQENRRARRFNLSIAVTLVLHDTKHRLVLANPVRGKLIDISLYGARLSIPHIRTGNNHLFYACNDDPAKVIHLEVLDKEGEDLLVVPAHPVWFDHVLVDPASKHFELGVEFLVPPEDPNITRLHAFVALQPAPLQGGWLKKLLQLGQTFSQMVHLR